MKLGMKNLFKEKMREKNKPKIILKY